MNAALMDKLRPYIVAFLIPVLGLSGWGIKAWGEDLVNQTVDTKIKKLEKSIDELKSSGNAAQTQQAIQGEQLRAIIKQQDEQRQDIKEILRALKD